jgi:hypothetical protein
MAENDDLKTRPCDICHRPASQVLNYDPVPVRVGWLCVHCWPDPLAFHKAILRERQIT